MLAILPNTIIPINHIGLASSIHLPSQSPAAPDAAIIHNAISTEPKILQNVFILNSPFATNDVVT